MGAGQALHFGQHEAQVLGVDALFACGHKATIGRALQGDLDDSEITSRTAAAHMIAVVAEEMEGGLQYKLSDGVLVLGAVLPEPDGMIG